MRTRMGKEYKVDDDTQHSIRDKVIECGHRNEFDIHFVFEILLIKLLRIVDLKLQF